MANGGGGGNDHNAGGGGGGNCAGGGIGGNNGEANLFNCKGVHPGVGSWSQGCLGNSFLGGGGGAGHGNNNLGTNGGNGGGIIILIANSISGNGYAIRSNGNGAPNTSGGDGAGGGGGGGTIELVTDNIVSNLSVEAKGGDGGIVYLYATVPRCLGPGGGGAGGVVKFSGTTPALATIDLAPGIPGRNIIGNVNGTSTCENSTSGATAGTSGTILENQTLPSSAIDYPNCDILLPIELSSFEARAIARKVELSWTTVSEVNNDYFTIERSRNGIDFIEVAQLNGAGNSMEPLKYAYTHNSPWVGRSYYRIKQTDFDGESTYSKINLVYVDSELDLYGIYPNPVKSNNSVQLEIFSKRDLESTVMLLDLMGREVAQQHYSLSEGFNRIAINSTGLAAGTYILRFQAGQSTITRKLVVF